MVILELGAGFNTPGVIRWPMEKLLESSKNIHLIRINLEYPEVPDHLTSQCTSLNKGIGYCLHEIRGRIKN